ncbi:hypothetical protein CSV86_007980 [Pseudomonas putida CSV86]|uniref:Uncharacterized protein n=1 Tax=Pseudomonas bharatica CSV86 TaxID=1005395 RepID=A0A7K4EC04_9PSED|nr:hypothetical protein [Pseudomonas bharatica CSV86]
MEFEPRGFGIYQACPGNDRKACTLVKRVGQLFDIAHGQGNEPGLFQQVPVWSLIGGGARISARSLLADE